MERRPDRSDARLPPEEAARREWEKLDCDGGGKQRAEEFVESDYYKDLNSVGEQHHTTGTGFIGMDKNNGTSFLLSEDSRASRIEHHTSSKGNPSTNEWIASAHTVFPASEKPNRSDS